MLSVGPRRAPFYAVAALVGVAAFFSVPARAASSRPIAVKSFEAPCEVRRAAQAGKWYAARVGMELKVGDVLRTGKGGKAHLAMSDGSRMTLGPNSRIQVEQVAPNRVFGLDAGKVKSFIKKLRKDTQFQVKTPLAAASVRGTVFEVGFDEGTKEGYLAVDEGQVSLAKDGKEVFVNEGERVGYNPSSDLGAAAPAPQGADAGGSDKAELRREVGLGMSKEEVMAAAADEMRLAEYQEGKVLTDVFGKRVRLEEYIVRRPRGSAQPDNTVKLVVLNEREDRFDYFYLQSVFNTALPADLSVALREMRGKLGAAAPTYYVTDYERAYSNTIDSVRDTATGGHLVRITFDGTDYTLHDPTGTAPDRTVSAAAVRVVGGNTYYDVYDPVADKTTSVSAAAYAAGGHGPVVYDSANDTFRAFTAADTFYRTSFNGYTHAINGTTKQSYTGTQVLSLDLDATWTVVNGGSVVAVTDDPSGEDKLHERVRLFYSNGTFETYNNHIIDDEGAVGPTSAFAGITTGAAYKNELVKWNYELVIEATEFQGRKIDLVVEPKILIKSGIIQ